MRFSTTLLAAALCVGSLSAAPPDRTLPTVVVEDSPAPTSSLGEEALVGPYDQPEWTGHRRFTTTRVYLQRQPWEIGFEQWWRVRTYDGEPSKHLFIEELEIGLPHRFQLDLYYDWAHEKGRTISKDYAVELRYALADWGVIPLNPTLYAEYKFTDDDYGSDVYELKLLLGDDLAPRLHWGVNFVFERETHDEEAQELAATQGLSYTIIDEVLSAGLEMQYKYETVKGDRHNGEKKFQIGPSVQWRPTHNTHLDLVALVGCTKDSPDYEGFVIYGIDLGRPGSPSHYKPVSGTHQ